MLENYGTPNPIGTDTIEVVCRNCGRTRRAVRVVARMLPMDEQGRAYTEVCHECLNEERLVHRKGRARTP
ncbi:MAG: hypothetical protein M1401_08405 [Chloroflexi bacterium]|nr:hypothetical protein [Chloroflexota bacterium]MCL5108868.1 hypothetical protein [Chloroflexota bacterium]